MRRTAFLIAALLAGASPLMAQPAAQANRPAPVASLVDIKDGVAVFHGAGAALVVLVLALAVVALVV